MKKLLVFMGLSLATFGYAFQSAQVPSFTAPELPTITERSFQTAPSIDTPPTPSSRDRLYIQFELNDIIQDSSHCGDAPEGRLNSSQFTLCESRATQTPIRPSKSFCEEDSRSVKRKREECKSARVLLWDVDYSCEDVTYYITKYDKKICSTTEQYFDLAQKYRGQLTWRYNNGWTPKISLSKSGAPQWTPSSRNAFECENFEDSRCYDDTVYDAYDAAKEYAESVRNLPSRSAAQIDYLIDLDKYKTQVLEKTEARFTDEYALFYTNFPAHILCTSGHSQKGRGYIAVRVPKNDLCTVISQVSNTSLDAIDTVPGQLYACAIEHQHCQAIQPTDDKPQSPTPYSFSVSVQGILYAHGNLQLSLYCSHDEWTAGKPSEQHSMVVNSKQDVSHTFEGLASGSCLAVAQHEPLAQPPSSSAILPLGHGISGPHPHDRVTDAEATAIGPYSENKDTIQLAYIQ